MKRYFENNSLMAFTLITLLFSVIFSSFKPVPKNSNDNWDLLATRKVDFVRDKDVIQIGSGTSYSAIKFSAQDKPIAISEVKVYFANGDKLEPTVDDIIKQGEESKVIELSGDGKAISKIEFKYRTIGSILKGRATVMIYGRH